jgi:hypothetical protein
VRLKLIIPVAIMKKIATFCPPMLFLFFYSIPVNAQKLELIPFAGYETSAKIKSYDGVFRINGGMDFGAALDFGSHAYKIELSYSRMASNLTYTVNGTSNRVCDLAVSYISIGGVADIYRGDLIVPYAKIALGGTYYHPLNNNITSETVMHFDITGGAKFHVSDHIGFRVQASFLFPVFSEGMYFEEAVPSLGQGMNTKVTGIQGNFTGGLAVRF